MELFWLKGYGSTSVADILSRSQVNSGSLYYFFPGKQDVLVAVLEAYRDGIGPMLLEPAWAAVDDPVERVFALLACYRRALVDTDCTYGCPIGSLALELHEPDPAGARADGGQFHRLGRRGRGAASLRPPTASRPTLDLRALAELVLNVMEGGVMQARTFRDVAHFDRAIAQLRAHFDCAHADGSARPSQSTGEEVMPQVNLIAVLAVRRRVARARRHLVFADAVRQGLAARSGAQRRAGAKAAIWR